MAAKYESHWKLTIAFSIASFLAQNPNDLVTPGTLTHHIRGDIQSITSELNFDFVDTHHAEILSMY